ncbi:class I SAM-dependent methyltransferase [Actinoplanes sp. G11-F43]|uniref:class I SAM-dependent methyltransferase n=1 Tax=Actinoplanes sp. G11-F43 TaxID=3424130 RepID=UPI003D34E760
MRELMMGVEGLALLRTATTGDDDFVAARVDSLRRLAGERGAGKPLTELSPSDGYAVWAERYDTLPNFVIAAEEPAVAAILDGLPPGRALDAACGTGRHAARLSALGHRVTGVDQSPEMLAKAVAKVPGAHFETGTLDRLPGPGQAYDLVVCGLALAHVAELGPAIGELRRVLAPGGRLVITDPHPFMTLLQGPAMFVRPDGGLGFVPYHVHLAADYLTAFAAHGLTVRSCREPLFAGPLPPGGYEERIADAAMAAWKDIPAAIVWDLEAR